MTPPEDKNRNPLDDSETIPPRREAGQAMYLRLMTEQLLGWDDPAAMLERAIKEDQFLLLTQKFLPLKTGVAESACHEVLLRMKQEEDNLLPPGSFLDLAESLGKMQEIDLWVVHALIAWGTARLRSQPTAQLPMMCVNVSSASLTDPAFVKAVRERLHKSGYPPRALCFEISERDVIDHHDATQKFIVALKPGCRITVDAFGSGKVSFSHLSGLAIDFIKIDGVIIQNILRDPSEFAKANAINRACQKLGVRTIAESVESKETLDKLREIGVDYVQGFGIARPESIDKLA